MPRPHLKQKRVIYIGNVDLFRYVSTHPFT